jgi:hypothetical protein
MDFSTSLSSILSTIIAVLSVLRVTGAIIRTTLCSKRHLENRIYITRDLYLSILFIFPAITSAAISWTDFSFGQFPAYYLPLGLCVVFPSSFEVCRFCELCDRNMLKVFQIILIHTVLEEGFTQRWEIWSVVYFGLSFSGKCFLALGGPFIHPFLFQSILICIFIDYVLFSSFWFWILLYYRRMESRKSLLWQCCCFLFSCVHILVVLIFDSLSHTAWPVLVEVRFLISISIGARILKYSL